MHKTIGTFTGISAILSIALHTGGCSGSSTPGVFDGLYLNYVFTGGDPCQFTFDKFEDNKFSVSSGECGLRADGFASDETVEVDEYMQTEDGKTVKWGEVAGEIGVLWLPDGLRNSGKRIPGGWTISGPKQWKDWTVFEAGARVGILASSSYYDADSGYLVGFEKEFAEERNVIFTLEDTNAPME